MNRKKTVKYIATLFAILVGISSQYAIGAPKKTTSVANGNWNVATTWNNGVPAATDTAVINNTVTVTAAASVAKIVINAAGTLKNTSALTVSNAIKNSGTYTDVSGSVTLSGNSVILLQGPKSVSFYDLTINAANGVTASDTISVKDGLTLTKGTLDVTAGYLILQNDATYNGRVISVGNNGDINGTFRAEIWDARCSSAAIASDYSTYGPPMATNLNSMGLFLFQNAYTYDETQPGNKSVGYVAIATKNTTISRGQGFFYDYTNYNGGPNFARKIPIIGTISFATQLSFPITYTSSSGGLTNDGWNLVGNPYPGT